MVFMYVLLATYIVQTIIRNKKNTLAIFENDT